MAEGNYRAYLKGEMVKAKKYFYVLRPILACRWILDKGTPPPVMFSELMKAGLPDELRGDVKRLLDLKMNSPEVKEIPRIDRLNEYMNTSIDEIKSIVQSMDEKKEGTWEELNKFFLNVF